MAGVASYFQKSLSRIDIHWTRQERKRIIHIQSFTNVEWLAGRHADQRSVITHAPLDLLKKSLFANPCLRLF